MILQDESKRIKTLSVLKRIKDKRLDDCGQQLQAIRAEQASIMRELDELRDQLNANAADICFDTIGLYAQCFAALSQKKSECLAQLEALNVQAEAMMSEVQHAYREAKTNERLLETSRSRLEQSLAQKDQDFLSDIGTQLYLRQRAENT